MWGGKRSQLEVFIEKQILQDFPLLTTRANDRETFGVELDFYFPTIQAAVEINGPLHYLPVYGEEKLLDIQIKDSRKLKVCNENKIKLMILDVSGYKNRSEKKNSEYYKIVKDFIQICDFNSRKINPLSKGLGC